MLLCCLCCFYETVAAFTASFGLAAKLLLLLYQIDDFDDLTDFDDFADLDDFDDLTDFEDFADLDDFDDLTVVVVVYTLYV